jgi:cytochrome c553
MRTLLLALTVACGAPDAVAIRDYGQSHVIGQRVPRPTVVALDNRAMVAAHMRDHFDDLRTIERMLIAGKLEDAKARAFLLTPASDRGLARWEVQRRRMTEAAKALRTAPSIDTAIEREARVAAACAGCHLAAQELPALPAAPALPPDDGTRQTRMARHQWAVDRLWEGMIVPADKPWRDGLAVLADTPLPADGSRTAAVQLQRRARAELDAPVAIDKRAAVYHRLLVTCTDCHATQHVVVGM